MGNGKSNVCSLSLRRVEPVGGYGQQLALLGVYGMNWTGWRSLTCAGSISSETQTAIFHANCSIDDKIGLSLAIYFTLNI